ncbi:Disrupted in schizophrenia 1 protein [Chelonia mydas]|uniref:Disrupted in schizophrenia 1 protein n=1 Tax=Chelonia mydas TaxID=8469 RepID=M7BMZ6_CHEMY|nr:Disrupted in schizophrenia 1 protein [Chelonia mydas]
MANRDHWELRGSVPANAPVDIEKSLGHTVTVWMYVALLGHMSVCKYAIPLVRFDLCLLQLWIRDGSGELVEKHLPLSKDSSDAASAGSSVTSGYESSFTVSDHNWDTLMRKYEPVLLDCLVDNRSTLKIKSLMLRLQRLQEKAIEEDDYDKGETFSLFFSYQFQSVFFPFLILFYNC